MRQLAARVTPWIPTILILGILTALFESVEERDMTSTFVLALSLIAALVLVRQRRPLNRDEVRAEIIAGVKAMVVREALQYDPTVAEARTLDLPVIPKEDRP